MKQPPTVTIAVVTQAQDDVEKLNKVLRESGYAANCQWLSSAEKFGQFIDESVDLIVVHADRGAGNPADILALARKREQFQPLVVIAESISEADISAALEFGAADLITLSDVTRLRFTLQRELRIYHLEQQVKNSLDSATQHQKQLTSLFSKVPDAIAHVHEGIIVHTNKAWVELFGFTDEDAFAATPLMDVIARASQAAVKGALVATAKGKWTGDLLSVNVVCEDGSEKAIQIELQNAEFDDEPAIRLAVTAPAEPDKRTASLLNDAVNKDQSTFLFHRTHFLKQVDKRIGQQIDEGLRVLAWIRIDDFKLVRDQLGVIGSEEVIAEFAEVMRKCLLKCDIAGRFEGTAFTVLLERSTEQDAKTWAEQFVSAVSRRVFESGDLTVKLTCSVGLCSHTGYISNTAELLENAEKSYRDARKLGRANIRMKESDDEDTRMRTHDALWAKRLTSALKENRFRLLQQPIAALDGESRQVFDILVRLMDEQGDLIAPSEFLPAAERNNMMQAIDRWVVGASIALCRERKPDLLFVRLSNQSLTDRSFAAWLKSMLAQSGIRPNQLCFQVAEPMAIKYLKAVQQTATIVRALGAGFALEHMGTTEQSVQLMANLPLDYAKIDGSLILNLSSDEQLHAKTSKLVEIARSKNIKTIAEKVEDANTMAALWQLGISYMQGHYVQEPEVILQETA